MYNTFIIYWLLLVVITVNSFDSNYRFKIFPNEHTKHINKHEFKQPCGQTNKSNGHQIKNYPKIPLSIIMELNEVTSIDELLWKFIPLTNVYNALKNKTTNDNQNSTIVPKAATCTTENRTISLRDDDNPSLYYSPSCTRVKRCGGCCGSNLVSCQPTEIETLNFEVTVLQYNETFTLKEKKIVTVEQHVKCKCDCIVKEEDCKPLQVYNDKECSCVCNNFDDQSMCEEEQGTRIWDSETCSCLCIEEVECTTGFKFDYNTCKCEPSEDP